MSIICAICHGLLQDSTGSQIVSSTPCGHVFHDACLRQWFVRVRSCPECRQPVLENRIIRVHLNFENETSNPSKSAALAVQMKLKESVLGKVRGENAELIRRNQELREKAQTNNELKLHNAYLRYRIKQTQGSNNALILRLKKEILHLLKLKLDIPEAKLKEIELNKLRDVNDKLFRKNHELLEKVKNSASTINENNNFIKKLSDENLRLRDLEAKMKHKESALSKFRNENFELKRQNRDLVEKIEQSETKLSENNALIHALTKENSQLSTLKSQLKLKETELNRFYNENVNLRRHNQDLLVKVKNTELTVSDDKSLILTLTKENSYLSGLKNEVKLKTSELNRCREENAKLKRKHHESCSLVHKLTKEKSCSPSLKKSDLNKSGNSELKRPNCDSEKNSPIVASAKQKKSSLAFELSLKKSELKRSDDENAKLSLQNQDLLAKVDESFATIDENNSLIRELKKENLELKTLTGRTEFKKFCDENVLLTKRNHELFERFGTAVATIKENIGAAQTMTLKINDLADKVELKEIELDRIRKENAELTRQVGENTGNNSANTIVRKFLPLKILQPILNSNFFLIAIGCIFMYTFIYLFTVKSEGYAIEL